MAGWALGACSAPAPVVCDPACGGGAFLLAAAEQLEARGLGRAEIVGRLVAIDIEPDAVRTTALALGEWCGGAAEPLTMVGDALVERWPAAPDVVVGNPPFLSQLGTATARSRSRAHKVVDRLGGAASGYVDDAALFLLAAARAVVPGGSVALVQPESVLATRSAAAVRAELAPMLERVWLGGSGLFDAEVRVCAVVLRRDRTGPALVEGDRWAAVVAAARGVPPVSLDGPALGGHARVTAGFRDEYYGLLPLLRESQPGDAPVVTSGLIDPAACRWGARPARIGKRRWSAPGVPPASLPPWALALREPKIVVSTQTRVVEAAADVGGRWVPSTPVLSVVPDPERLWHLLAALLSPAASAWAFAHAAGAALSGDALKLSAAQLRSLPLPDEGTEWDAAAAHVRAATEAASPADRREALVAAATASCRAYRTDPEPLLDWWLARLPT